MDNEITKINNESIRRISFVFILNIICSSVIFFNILWISNHFLKDIMLTFKTSLSAGIMNLFFGLALIFLLFLLYRAIRKAKDKNLHNEKEKIIFKILAFTIPYGAYALVKFKTEDIISNLTTFIISIICSIIFEYVYIRFKDTKYAKNRWFFF